MAGRPGGEMAFLAAAAAGALALVLYLTFRRKTASKEPNTSADSGIKYDEKSQVLQPANDGTTKNITSSGDKSGKEFEVVSSVNHSEEPHTCNIPNCPYVKDKDLNTILDEHTKYFDIYSNRNSNTKDTHIYNSDNDVKCSQTSNIKLQHSCSQEGNLHTDVSGKNADDSDVLKSHVRRNDEILTHSDISLSKFPKQCKDEKNIAIAQSIYTPSAGAFGDKTEEVPLYSEETLPNVGSEHNVSDPSCDGSEQTFRIQSDSDAVLHQAEEKDMNGDKKNSSTEKTRQVEEASGMMRDEGAKFSVSFIPEYKATFHCSEDVPTEMCNQKYDKTDSSLITTHEEDFEKSAEQQYICISSRDKGPGDNHMQPVQEGEYSTVGNIIVADSGDQTGDATPCLFALSETNNFGENTNVHFVHFVDPTDALIRVDAGEEQAYLDMDYEGDVSSGSSSNDSDPLSELHIFGRLPPPYGFEQTTEPFSESEEPTYINTELAFSPPSEFKDGDSSASPLPSPNTEPSNKVPRNGHSSGITYSIMGSYSSSLYTHYEESENEADSGKNAPSVDSDDNEHLSCNTLIFEMDVSEKLLSEPLQENQHEHSCRATDEKVDEVDVRDDPVNESNQLQNTEVLVKDDDENRLLSAQDDTVMYTKQGTSSTDQSLSEQTDRLSPSDCSRSAGDCKTDPDSIEDYHSQMSDGQVLQQSCSNVLDQRPDASLENSVSERDKDTDLKPAAMLDGDSDTDQRPHSYLQNLILERDPATDENADASLQTLVFGEDSDKDSDSSDSSNDTVVLCDTYGQDVATELVDEESQEGSGTKNKIQTQVLLSEAGDVPAEGAAAGKPKGEPVKDTNDKVADDAPAPKAPVDEPLVPEASGDKTPAPGKPADGAKVPSAPPAGGKSAEVSYTEVEKTVGHVSKGAENMTALEAKVLTDALSTKDQELQQKVLVTIANAGAFHKNLVLLREAGCLKRLTHLLSAHKMALRVGQSVSYPALVTQVVNTITNLAADEQNQQQLQECIPALIDFAKSESSPESVQVSSLQALINLSVTSAYHPPYTQLIQHLYECLDNGSPTLQLHALKVLINLSANPEMVPHLLAAKAPTSLPMAIVPQAEEDVLLRWMTLLANVMWTAREKKLTNTSLPTEYKAASPETMWTAIYGLNTKGHLRSKVFVLSKHKNQEIRYYASRIYSCLV